MVKIDRIIRSKRTSIGLMVNAQAQLIIRAPLWMPSNEIERFIAQKQNWIIKKQELFRRRKPRIEKQFVDGEEFLFLGKSFQLKILDDLPKAVLLDGDLMINRAVLKNAKDHLKIWYQNQALEYIDQRVKHYAQLTGLVYKTLKINDAKARWGSCSYKETLNFTWRLIMAPERVIDYVVVHELMHLKQMNHSAKFWNEVRNLVPDYKVDEQWLKDNGYRLHF